MLDNLTKDFNTKTSASLEALDKNLRKIRTGRAHPSLIESVVVDYYGSLTPLSQVASISTIDARTLQVTPWEKNTIQAIEKGILVSDLGLNPMVQGVVIRIPLPPLTQERRIALGKIVKQNGEAAKIAVRSSRRDILTQIKKLLKDKSISEDEDKRFATNLQNETDIIIRKIDEMVTIKEKELLEI
jgi:ribosome recycling factor